MNAHAAAVKKQPLDEVMLAMDVVDTLRHRRKLVERELDSDNRDQELKDRLRKIYAAQGIDVPDHVLEEGVAALKEDRFVYKPPPNTFAKKLAELYVNRHKWGKWVFGLFAALVIGWSLYQYAVVAPRSALPEKIETAHRLTTQAAKSDSARELANQQYAKAMAALRGSDVRGAQAGLESLSNLRSSLEQEYTLRIVSGPGQRSGIWRIPDANTRARNYYIIVEAVDVAGRTLAAPVTNEETGKTESASKWGLRVDERVFRQVMADKQDDGIIQNNRFGIKRSGFLKPEYLISTTGAAITRW